MAAAPYFVWVLSEASILARFAYNNQFNVPQLTGELKPEPSTLRMPLGKHTKKP